MALDLQSWNARVIEEFRANAGVVGWSSAADLAGGRPVPPPLPTLPEGDGVPILLLRHTGARTGRRRTTPLVHQPVGDGFAVVASHGGSPRAPAWYRNVVAHPEVTIEVRTTVTAAVARVARGVERDRIWAEQVRLMPALADFQAAAGRLLPVIVLDPVPGGTVVS